MFGVRCLVLGVRCLAFVVCFVLSVAHGSLLCVCWLSLLLVAFCLCVVGRCVMFVD